MTETITLTEEQIDAGRMAAVARSSQWKPTPKEAVALARQLFEERGQFRQREAREVANLSGRHEGDVKHRMLCGELGLPSPNIPRALAFAAGEYTYFRPDGSEHRVNDDMNYQRERHKWLSDWWCNAAFDSLTQGFIDALWVENCPCCGVKFRSGSIMTSPTLDHLVPGVLNKGNARLLCRGCNSIKQNALPWHLHRVADWMTKTPAEMLDFARTLPAMPRHRVDGQDRWKGLFWGKKSNARERGIYFSMSFDDVTFTAFCPVLGVPFLLPGSEEMAAHWKISGKKVGPTWSSPSFDRIDPRQGYVPGNVVLVSNLANNIMNNCTTPDRVRLVADWFERELAAAPELAALIDYDAHEHWKIAAE